MHVKNWLGKVIAATRREKSAPGKTKRLTPACQGARVRGNVLSKVDAAPNVGVALIENGHVCRLRARHY